MRITPNHKAGAGVALRGISLLDGAAICNRALYRKCCFGKSSAQEREGLSEIGVANVINAVPESPGGENLSPLPHSRSSRPKAALSQCRCHAVISWQAIKLFQGGHFKGPQRLDILQNTFSKTSLHWNSSNIKFKKIHTYWQLEVPNPKNRRFDRQQRVGRCLEIHPGVTIPILRSSLDSLQVRSSGKSTSSIRQPKEPVNSSFLYWIFGEMEIQITLTKRSSSFQ